MENYDFGKFTAKFIDDASNLLDELECKLLELEHNNTNKELIESVFRTMHTLKGIGSMFGFSVISEYTHHLETIYDKIREGFLSIDSVIFEVTLASVDHLRNLLADKELQDKHLVTRHQELSEQIIHLSQAKPITNAEPVRSKKGHSKAAEQPATWYIQFTCSEKLIKRAVNIAFIFQDLAKIGTYTIFKHPQGIHHDLNNTEEVWGILLTTNASFSDIEEVFMFVYDDVKIVKFAGEEQDELSETASAQGTDEVRHISIFELAQKVASNQEKNNGAVQNLSLPSSEAEPHRKSGKIPRISVGADKLDKLMFLVGELFTTRSELVIATRNSSMEQVKQAVEKIDRLSSQLRNNALSIRLVPLREITLKFKRLIRDLSNHLGKNIDFEVQGDETELDKNLVDNLSDPFMHIIRNCIDHGIETPEIREVAQKSENGLIRFVAYQSGNYIYIQISDDGKGIDCEYIRKKAIEKGFIQPNAQLSEKEMLELIFLPGFSTAESLTQVSGRGVGMDVVKRAITNLRGSIEVETEKGKGTTFTIKLQQTIAIMDTLLINAGNSYFTIILEDVEICELENHHKLYDRQNNHLQIADDLLPFVSLRNAFAIKGEAPLTERIIVIKNQNFRYAIVADNIIGQYQAVIKPLGSLLKHKEYISGASIMGDGNIAFMLDTLKLGNTLN